MIGFNEGIFKKDVCRQIIRIFPSFWREPFLALGGFSNNNFASRRNTDYVCSNPAQESPRFSLFLVKRFTYWRKGTVVAMTKVRWEENTIGPKARKTKILITSATHNTKHEQTFNETATARPPTELAPQSGTVVGCCAVSCFGLPRYLFYTVFFT